MHSETQESRTDRLTVSCTPREKLAVQMVAGRHGTDVSNLFRERFLPQLMEEYEGIRAQLESGEPIQAGAA